ncbi:glutaminyl-peptide cyclotransferase [Candidatus Bathyarchaeota archaeon]|nr:glutaminyl-peptide cyclotransferase [Candidatus Bathyarchaeota archaeon]
MQKWILAIIFVVLLVTFSLFAYIVFTNTASNKEPLNYTYSIANKFNHDSGAFTEGLVYEDGALFESTGGVFFGDSSLRRVNLSTGTPLQLAILASNFFGEGITIFEGKIIQLTWRSEKGFVYDKNSFEILSNFSYLGEGWGITHDGNRLIMSNGSAILTFLDPNTFEVAGTLWVHDGDMGVANLNELEYVNGDIYANVWQQNRIAIINLQTGQVKGWINLTGLYDASNADPENVLNGIAYDAENARLFVTGKRWPQLFEIKLEPLS